MANESNGVQRPNILYIQSDQHNPNVTGCYGESHDGQDPQPGRARRAGHGFHQRLLRRACLRTVEDILPNRTIPPRERGLGQLPYVEFGDPNLRPRDGRCRISTGTDRQDALHRL